MKQDRKIEALRKRGYSVSDIREHAELNCVTFATAVNRLLDYEAKFAAKQNTLNLGELETNPFISSAQGALFEL